MSRRGGGGGGGELVIKVARNTSGEVEREKAE